MTSCGDAREAVSARLDGERSDVTAAELADHLGDCPDCGAWASQATGIQATILRLGEPAFELGDAVVAQARGPILTGTSDQH